MREAYNLFKNGGDPEKVFFETPFLTIDAMILLFKQTVFTPNVLILTQKTVG